MNEPRPSTRTLKDPHLPWDGPFPYDRLNGLLAEIGQPAIDRDATGACINDVFFDLMGVATTDDRLVWDQLRQVASRLCLDFFLYQPLAPLDAAGDEAGAAEPIPVEVALQLPPLDLGPIRWGEVEPEAGA